MPSIAGFSGRSYPLKDVIGVFPWGPLHHLGRITQYLGACANIPDVVEEL